MTANSAKWKASFEAAADTPKADDVRRELRRLLESLAFRDSLRLTSFLKFVVEAVLEGKGDRIKSYTIAVEALGRGSAFDPQGPDRAGGSRAIAPGAGALLCDYWL